jgi:hypothetical protein
MPPKVSRGQRIRWTLMDREPASHRGHVVRIAEKPLDQCDTRFPANRSLNLISDCLRGGSNLRVPDIPPKDTRHFPIREWLCLAADFSTRRILSCVLQEQKSCIFAGKFWDCRLLFADSKRPKTVWWTWSGSNRRPLPCHFQG